MRKQNNQMFRAILSNLKSFKSWSFFFLFVMDIKYLIYQVTVSFVCYPNLYSDVRCWVQCLTWLCEFLSLQMKNRNLGTFLLRIMPEFISPALKYKLNLNPAICIFPFIDQDPIISWFWILQYHQAKVPAKQAHLELREWL